MASSIITPVEIRHFHAFCGSGGGAKGFNRGKARVANLVAKMRCLGGIDVDRLALRDFQQQAGVPGTHLDMFDLKGYRDFHRKDPPVGWREATPDDIRRAAGYEDPHIIFLSAPCKGFSGLLPASMSVQPKYVALNRLTLRGVWLMLEAWRDSPPALFVFENVPLLLHRGRELVDQIMALFHQFGYACAESVHDCGRLGGLGQSRKRCLIVARHMEQVPAHLYEPELKPLRSVGDVIGRMPLPGDPRGGPMHRSPNLQWRTWVRLAMVQAGKDWRSLKRLRVENGFLADYLLVPEMRNGAYGVNAWDSHMGVVQGETGPSNGKFSLADPRPEPSASWNAGQNYGVQKMDETSGAVSGQCWPNQGKFAIADCRTPPSEFHAYRVVKYTGTAGTITAGGCSPGAMAQSVADPRHEGTPKFSNESRVGQWSVESRAVTGAHGTGQCIADPRPNWDTRHGNNLIVGAWEEPSRTIIAGGKGVQGGWISISDPRPGMDADRKKYATAGHYGVLPMDVASGAVSASACHDNGYWSVADDRLPDANQKLTCRIISDDGTWHRPFTTLELAALQSLIDPEDYWSDDPIIQAEIDKHHYALSPFKLAGSSDTAWREHIGNLVPPAAAEAIASEMARTLLLSMTGETFILNSTPVWVRPLAMALSVAQGAHA